MDTAVRMISVAVRNRPGLPGLHVQKLRPEETNKTEPEEIARYLRGCVGPMARLPASGRVGPSGTRPGAPSPPPSSCAGPAGPPSRRRGGVGFDPCVPETNGRRRRTRLRGPGGRRRR